MNRILWLIIKNRAVYTIRALLAPHHTKVDRAKQPLLFWTKYRSRTGRLLEQLAGPASRLALRELTADCGFRHRRSTPDGEPTIPARPAKGAVG